MTACILVMNVNCEQNNKKRPNIYICTLGPKKLSSSNNKPTTFDASHNFLYILMTSRDIQQLSPKAREYKHQLSKGEVFHRMPHRCLARTEGELCPFETPASRNYHM
jgi:hypothetical protein